MNRVGILKLGRDNFLNMNIYSLREEIHQNPELSNCEKETAQRIASFLKPLNPTKLYQNIGGYGLLAQFGEESKATEKILFRCEMDALPIQEVSSLKYRSKVKNIAHLCGHDGHIAILCGVAEELSKMSLNRVIYLLFQPAEEIGEGAERVAKDLDNMEIEYDYSFAIHNYPDYPLSSIIISPNTYAYASVGIELHFKGESSHAAEPEKAINPTKLILLLSEKIDRLKSKTAFSTIINIAIGDIAYGTTPGEGYLRLTARAAEDLELSEMVEHITNLAKKESKERGLGCEITLYDRFPATVNSREANERVITAAKKLNLDIILAENPHKGSDDFALLCRGSKSAFFNIGSGENHPSLHQPNFDFPDEIIPKTVELISLLCQ